MVVLRTIKIKPEIRTSTAMVRFAIHVFERVWTELIVRIKGDAWKLRNMVIEELRRKKYPGLLKG